MLAAAKTSNGAPSAICRASRPVEPNENVTGVPVACSKAAPTSLKANVRSEAAATLSGSWALLSEGRLQPGARESASSAAPERLVRCDTIGASIAEDPC